MRLFFLLAAVVSTSLLGANTQAQSATQNTSQPVGKQQNSPARIQTPQVMANTPQTKTMAPDWYARMSQDHINFLNQLLDHWTEKSAEVKQYQCDFVRYDYDTTFCNWRNPQTNQLAAASYMTGKIRFASPDKACYETQQVFDFDGPPQQDGQNPTYKPRKDSTQKEKWICDGKSIYEFDYGNKKLYETEIPPEMQGKGLINSPLPFLFGASKEDILSRFWVRVITPEGAKNEYWLEAVPRKIEDARNYQKLEVIISRDKLFLPIALQIYAPNYNPAENKMTSRIFEFKNRKVNDGLHGIQNFIGWFVRPRKPLGFDWVKRQGLQAHQQFDPQKLQQRQTRAANQNPMRK